MNTWKRTAPAKINLALDILGRRGDGYHEMHMVMQSISLSDTVSLRETESGFVLRAEGVFLPAGKVTLEQQAAEAFFQETGLAMPGLEITLEKNVPAYAGLGGGSADVAALLRLLRGRYCPTLPDAALERIGLRVGSDMPFCVRGGTALAGGRGETLTDLPPLPPCTILLCKPEYGFPTGELFERVDRAALKSRPDVDGLAAAVRAGDLAGVAGRLGNVFEQVLTAEERRDIDAIRESMLQSGALGAAMSGSGPTVFGIYAREEAALLGAELLRTRYRQVYLAQPVKKFQQED